MRINELEKFANKFEALAQASDMDLIDHIAKSLDAAHHALSQGSESVARFRSAVAALEQAKPRWASMTPQAKLQLISGVFQQYANLPQSYMDPSNFRPVQLRDNISRLFSKLVSHYRG